MGSQMEKTGTLYIKFTSELFTALTENTQQRPNNNQLKIHVQRPKITFAPLLYPRRGTWCFRLPM